MGKLFGTDGIRGVVNAGLDADLAYKVGLAAAIVLSKDKKPGEKPLVTIGKDTRISGDLLKGSLIAGLCTAGADVLDLGTLPTPGVAWVTVDEGADAGIVISASHNPFEHNGIKIFSGDGFKLPDDLEERIESLILGEAPLPAAPAARQAIRWFWISLRSMALCSPSIQMKSKPQPAIISVTKGLSKPTWDPMASLPAATLSVIWCALYMGNSSFSNT